MKAVLVLDVAGLLLLTFFTTFGVARLRLLFDDILEGRRLPPLTNAFLAVPGAAYVLLFSGLIVALVWKEFYVAEKTRALAVNVAVFVAAAFFAHAALFQNAIWTLFLQVEVEPYRISNNLL